MIPTLIVFAALVAILAWIFAASRSSSHEPTVHRSVHDDIDRAELEAAERDVQEAAHEDEVRDWGPGATRPRPPELL